MGMNVNKIRHAGRIGRQKMSGVRAGAKKGGQKLRVSLAGLNKKTPR